MLKKEVWYIDQYLGHPKYGNVYRNFYIAKELQKKEIKIRVFSASYSHLMYNIPATTGKVTTEELDDVEFNWVKVKNYGGGRSFGRILSIFEFSYKLFFLKKVPPPDVIVTPSLSMLPIWPIMLLRHFFWKSKKPKIIFEIRDIWPLTLTTLGGKNKNNPFVKLLSITEKYAYRNADYIISTLKMCDQHIAKVIKQSFNFKWIDNGINISNESTNVPVEILDQIPKNKFIVGYTGALGLANAMNHFIQCAKLLKDHNKISFVIIGDGAEKQHLMEQAKDLPNILFLPKINKNYIPTILKQFDVLYFSYANVPELYKYGVSANKTYEYMLSAKPIILSAIEMEYNIIREARCGLIVPPENPVEIQDAILKIYNMPLAERIVMGENGKRYILQNNTFDILGEKVYNVIRVISK